MHVPRITFSRWVNPVLVWIFQDAAASPEISPGTSIPIFKTSSEKLDDLLEGSEEMGMEGCGV